MRCGRGAIPTIAVVLLTASSARTVQPDRPTSFRLQESFDLLKPAVYVLGEDLGDWTMLTGKTVLVGWCPDARTLSPNAKLPDTNPFIMHGGNFPLRGPP